MDNVVSPFVKTILVAVVARQMVRRSGDQGFMLFENR